MKKNILLLAATILLTLSSRSQGYDIKINFKGCTDTVVYLWHYNFENYSSVDTCAKFTKGNISFKGKNELSKGVYLLVNQDRAKYFDFFVNEGQKFSISLDLADLTGTLKATGSPENEKFFSYTKYISDKNRDFGKLRDQTIGKSKEDSTTFMNAKVVEFSNEVKKFDEDFMVKSKGTFIYDVFNLKTEKEAPEVPKAKNGRPDSIYQYYYYKNHFFDGVNFKDERLVRTPFFNARVKKYFDNVVLMNPDTMIYEIDQILAKCDENNLIYNFLIGYFAYKFEQSKMMGFDKVFVHVADTYIINGKAKGVYSEETVKTIKDRVDIMRNLVLGAKVADLYMIDTANGRAVRKMGFDTASTSKSITDLYYKNVDKLTPLFKTLYSINSKYTIIVFWAADCGHCQKEIPKLHTDLKAIKNSIDYKVFAVQTKDELYDSWKKFIIEQQLTDFIHVFDPVHINNLKERFDIYSTPVIYILDKDKKIKAKRLAAEQVVDFLKSLEAADITKTKN